MRHALDHREKAAQARRLAAAISQPDTVEQLLTFARDYEEIAMDLESGAAAVIHPERMPQRRG
jgi:hypothetical protein